jgi:hypothetical protein
VQRKRRYATQIMRKKTSSTESSLAPPATGTGRKLFTYFITIIILGFAAYYIYTKSRPSDTIVVEVEQENSGETNQPEPEQTDPAPPLEQKIQVEILNGCGKTGIAKIFENILRKKGFDVVNTGNYVENGRVNWKVKSSRVVDLSGKVDEAETAAEILGIAETHVISQINPKEIYDLRIVIGLDFKDLESYKSFSE